MLKLPWGLSKKRGFNLSSSRAWCPLLTRSSFSSCYFHSKDRETADVQSEGQGKEKVVICVLFFLGKNDGSVKGVRYFTCGAKRGVFVRPDKVLLDKRGRAVRNNNPGSSTKQDNSLMRRSTSKGMSNEPQNVLLIHWGLEIVRVFSFYFVK